MEQFGGLPICPKCTNLRLKKNVLYKIHIKIYLWKNVGSFDKWGVCQSAQNGPIWQFFNFFLLKIWIKRGAVLFKKNWQLMYLGPHNVGCFGQMVLSANGPKLGQFLTFNYIFLPWQGLNQRPLSPSGVFCLAFWAITPKRLQELSDEKIFVIQKQWKEMSNNSVD